MNEVTASICLCIFMLSLNIYAKGKCKKRFKSVCHKRVLEKLGQLRANDYDCFL